MAEQRKPKKKKKKKKNLKNFRVGDEKTGTVGQPEMHTFWFWASYL